MCCRTHHRCHHRQYPFVSGSRLQDSCRRCYPRHHRRCHRSAWNRTHHRCHHRRYRFVLIADQRQLSALLFYAVTVGVAIWCRITRIADAITVSIRLCRVCNQRTVVGVVINTVGIRITVRCAVARVTDTVTIGVGLGRFATSGQLSEASAMPSLSVSGVNVPVRKTPDQLLQPDHSQWMSPGLAKPPTQHTESLAKAPPRI